MEPDLGRLRRVAAMLRDAQHITVLTGAGVSAESGIPTFRAALTGHWARHRPEDLATPEAFARDPATVWAWYAHRRAGVRAAAPNAAHDAIAALARLVPRLTLATQNVDGLHARAGSPRVLELHGSIMRTRCVGDGHVVEDFDEASASPPPCPVCGSLLRPDIVWFGEPLPLAELQEAAQAAAGCDVLLVVGTSGLVYPVAGLPLAALDAGVPVVVIDPDAVPLAREPGVHPLQGPAGTVLPRLLREAWPEGPAIPIP